MFTTCPSCALNLAVTAADLRIGQGYVRCGRCVSVFNALISLADEAEVGPEQAPAVEDRAAATQSRPVPADLLDASRLDLGETDDIIASPAIFSANEAPPPTVEAAPAEPVPVVAAGPGPEKPEADLEVEEAREPPSDSRDQATGTFETIVLEGDTILQTEEFVDEAEVDEQIKALALRLEAHDAESLDSAVPRPLPDFVAESPPPAYAVADEDAVESLLGEPTTPRKRPPLIALVCAGLGLLLLVQVLHHWRHPLAGRMPWIGAVYAGIGAPLTTPWRLDAYDVRQLGAAASATDARRIEIRASIRNGADRAQPAPVLRVSLQDRFGNEIGRHERRPADYLRGRAGTLLGADQRVDATFEIDDPEQKAVGFELDACLPDDQGALRCTGDQPIAR